MLNRTLLYTAVTRARRVVVVVGQAKALAMAVRDRRREPRTTALRGLLDGSLAFTEPAGQAVGEAGDVLGHEPDWLVELAASGAGEER